MAVPVAQQMLTNYLTKGSSSGAGLKKRRRPKKGGDLLDDIMGMGLTKQIKEKNFKKGGSFLSSLGSVAKAVAPVAQQVAVPVAQQMLTNYLTKGSSSGAGVNKRGQLFKHIMAKEGLTLPQASSYIKQRNLM